MFHQWAPGLPKSFTPRASFLGSACGCGHLDGVLGIIQGQSPSGKEGREEEGDEGRKEKEEGRGKKGRGGGREGEREGEAVWVSFCCYNKIPPI